MIKALSTALTSIAVLSFIALAIEASDNFTVNHGTNQTITAHSTCQKVTNNSSTNLSVYVPTQTSAEWQSFRDNPPSGVTLASCSCTTPSYTGVHFDTAGSGAANPQGLAWDGTYFWVADTTDSRVYRYNANGTYSNFSFDTAGSGNTRPYGIVWDGTYFWIVNNSGGRVYRHNANGSYSGFSFASSAHYGIAWDGTYFWITTTPDLTNGRVYRYNANGTGGTFFNIGGSGNGYPNGIVWDGTALWVVDVTDAEVYKYACS